MLSNSGADLKMVKPKNIHLTVRFLGDIQQSMVDAIYEEMKQITFTSFQIQLEGLGAFPKLSYPRVVWAGIKRGAKFPYRISKPTWGIRKNKNYDKC